jgi:LysR family hydrogen peroxide-inducible transcriptional activator
MLGVIPTVAPFLLPVLLPPLRRRYPDLQLHLREDLTERLLERLRGGQLDMALIALPYATEDLLVRELFNDEFWFVAREDDPHAKEKAVAVKQLDLGQVLLLEEGHCLRDHAIAACGQQAPNAESRIEATSLNTLIQMVEGGLGTTLLPEMALKGGILKGTKLIARPFAPQTPSRTIVLATRPGSARRRDFELLADFIIDHYRRLRASTVPSRRSAHKAA